MACSANDGRSNQGPGHGTLRIQSNPLSSECSKEDKIISYIHEHASKYVLSLKNPLKRKTAEIVIEYWTLPHGQTLRPILAACSRPYVFVVPRGTLSFPTANHDKTPPKTDFLPRTTIERKNNIFYFAKRTSVLKKCPALYTLWFFQFNTPNGAPKTSYSITFGIPSREVNGGSLNGNMQDPRGATSLPEGDC